MSDELPPGMLMVITNDDGSTTDCFIPMDENHIRIIYDTMDVLVETMPDVNVLESGYALLLWVNYQLRMCEKRVGIVDNGAIMKSLAERASVKIEEMMTAIDNVATQDN